MKAAFECAGGVRNPVSRSQRRAALLCAGSLSIAALCAAPVQAQTSTGPQDSQANPQLQQTDGLGDIVVTARRRNEALSKVPATIVALTGEQITRQGVQSEADLQTSIPGLLVRSASGQNQLNFALRGQSVDAFSSSPPGVVSYVNEVPSASNSATAFYDLEGVQALKGPQGTLFGRNSTGGAVLFQTRRPGMELGGYGSVQYGNYDRFVAEAAIDLPLVTDKVAVRLAGTYTDGGAFVRNLYDGKRYGDREAKSGRVTLLLKPVEGVTNTTIAQISDFGGDNAPNRLLNAVSCGQPFSTTTCLWNPSVPAFNALGAADPRSFAGGLQALPAFLDAKKGRIAYADAPLTHSAKARYVANITEFEISPAATLKNIFGYDYSQAHDQYDYDNSPYPILFNGGTPGVRAAGMIKSRQFSDELQLQGKIADDKLTYIIGLFWARQSTFNDSPIQGTFIVPPSLSGQFAVRYNHRVVNETKAVFAQGTYAMGDQVNLTLGGRYTWDKVESDQLPGSLFLPAFPNQQRVKLDDPSWTATLDYRPVGSLLLYVSTRGSWRAGSYNPFAPPLGDEVTAAGGGNYFTPERVRDVEAGAKLNGRLGGVPAQINLAVYNSWISDVQRTIYVTIAGNIASLTVNVPKAKITGAELDGQIRPAPWLTLGGSLTYTNARFTNGRSVLFGQEVLYGPYADTPEWSGSLFAQVSKSLPGDAGELVLRTDMTAQSHFYFSNLGDTLNPNVKIPGYALVNLRLDWSRIGGTGLSAGFFVRNITNKIYYAGGLPQIQNFSSNSAAYGAPRQIGGVLRYDF